MFGKTMVRIVLAAALLASAVTVQAASVFNMPNGQTSLSFVSVGDPGNVADPATGYGSVGYSYQIGTYDVTLGQYTAFLNAVAETDTYGLYDSNLHTEFATQGIRQTGSPGNYSYSVTGSNPQAANCPVFDVTWGDAARFCNWLQNGQPTSGTEAAGTTETGSYTLSGATSSAALLAVTRNPGATYVIPSANEWYKAAYYSGGGINSAYYTYPTKSDIAPDNSLVLAPTEANDANYYISGYTDPTNYMTAVGTFAASPGPYGTYDMGGDVWEWTETRLGSSRDMRGGYWDSDSSHLLSANFNLGDPANLSAGFRVAIVPEPGSIALLLAGAVALGIWRQRRKAQ